jgi:hypothetical protein
VHILNFHFKAIQWQLLELHIHSNWWMLRDSGTSVVNFVVTSQNSCIHRSTKIRQYWVERTILMIYSTGNSALILIQFVFKISDILKLQCNAIQELNARNDENNRLQQIYCWTPWNRVECSQAEQDDLNIEKQQRNNNSIKSSTTTWTHWRMNGKTWSQMSNVIRNPT